MSVFAIFTILMSLLTVLSVFISLFSSIRFSKMKIKRKNIKIRKALEIQTEGHVMEDLMNGRIKCHILPNSASSFKVESWVSGMLNFMKKPIYKQILSLEGKNIDEEY